MPADTEPLRVLSVGNVYPPHHLGGYELIWAGLVRHLRDAGLLARVLTTTYRRSGVHQADDPDVHRELRWYWHEHAWPSMSMRARVRLERHNAAVLHRHLRELQPHVVMWWGMGGMSLSLIEHVRQAGVPAVFFVLDPWMAYGPVRDRWLRTWSRRPLAPLAAPVERIVGLPTRVRLDAAGRWLFCSTSMREQAAAAGLRPADAAVLAPGVSSDYLRLPRQPGPGAWRWRLLYLGRVVEQKGVVTTVEALAQLPVEAALRIVGAGDEPYRRELEALAARLGVADRVRLEAPRDRAGVLAAYEETDAVLFPVTWEEPFGLVPLEAMAAGRPVLATSRGGAADFLRDGQNALLFPAHDAAALAAAVRRLAQEPDLRARLRLDGFATADAHGEEAFNLRAAEELAAVARERR